LWAGAGTLEAQLKAAVKQLGVTKQVKLLGERQDISDWLDVADIFFLRNEGMPLAVMEAMARLLSNCFSSGIPELIRVNYLLTQKLLHKSQSQLVTTIRAWSINPELRHAIGQACKRRAEEMFREERMVKETVEVIKRALLPVRGYVSPGFSIIQPDGCFPNMVVGDTNLALGLTSLVPHNWYVDRRQQPTGFLNRDEAHIFTTLPLSLRVRALEIGCWLGWSACHLAPGVELDVVDPLLEQT